MSSFTEGTLKAATPLACPVSAYSPVLRLLWEWVQGFLNVVKEETNLEFLYLLSGGKDSKNSALPFSRRAAKLVFCYLSLTQGFKFSLALLSGELTSYIFF